MPGDNLGRLELARFTEPTRSRLERLLSEHGIGAIVGARNPLDLTPVLGDEGFAAFDFLTRAGIPAFRAMDRALWAWIAGPSSTSLDAVSLRVVPRTLHPSHNRGSITTATEESERGIS